MLHYEFIIQGYCVLMALFVCVFFVVVVFFLMITVIIVE